MRFRLIFWKKWYLPTLRKNENSVTQSIIKVRKQQKGWNYWLGYILEYLTFHLINRLYAKWRIGSASRSRWRSELDWKKVDAGKAAEIFIKSNLMSQNFKSSYLNCLIMNGEVQLDDVFSIFRVINYNLVFSGYFLNATKAANCPSKNRNYRK